MGRYAYHNPASATFREGDCVIDTTTLRAKPRPPCDHLRQIPGPNATEDAEAASATSATSKTNLSRDGHRHRGPTLKLRRAVQAAT